MKFRLFSIPLEIYWLWDLIARCALQLLFQNSTTVGTIWEHNFPDYTHFSFVISSRQVYYGWLRHIDILVLFLLRRRITRFWFIWTCRVRYRMAACLDLRNKVIVFLQWIQVTCCTWETSIEGHGSRVSDIFLRWKRVESWEEVRGCYLLCLDTSTPVPLTSWIFIESFAHRLRTKFWCETAWHWRETFLFFCGSAAFHWYGHSSIRHFL